MFWLRSSAINEDCSIAEATFDLLGVPVGQGATAPAKHNGDEFPVLDAEKGFIGMDHLEKPAVDDQITVDQLQFVVFT